MNFNTRSLIRQTLTVGLCVSIGLTALGFGQAKPAGAVSFNKGKSIIETGKRYLGVPYDFGAKSGVTYEFDCSSFTQYVFKRNGISLPRTAKQQSYKGKYVSKKNLRRGDLMFFKVPGRSTSIGHVAIYAGFGKMLHTYGAGGVKFTSIDNAYWKKNYVTARRF
jgi:cell wall-associated NlpC family hydrolase